MDHKYKIIRAWLVHLYTAAGLITTFAAFRALLDGDARTVFLWQGVALFIDATDGPLARRWEVSRWIPSFSGRKLDDIIDYINYTLIPMLFAYSFGMVTGLGRGVLPLVLIVSAYGFCQEQAKTDDGYFTGFPSYWNLVIFYLYLLGAAPWVSTAVLTTFAVLVFVPVKYLTWKSPRLGRLTMGFSLVWFLSLGGMMLWFDQVPDWVVWVSLLYPVYHLGISFYLFLTRRS
jgi:phosphatidylcholine synthase